MNAQLSPVVIAIIAILAAMTGAGPSPARLVEQGKAPARAFNRAGDTTGYCESEDRSARHTAQFVFRCKNSRSAGD